MLFYKKKASKNSSLKHKKKSDSAFYDKKQVKI